VEHGTGWEGSEIWVRSEVQKLGGGGIGVLTGRVSGDRGVVAKLARGG